jgi:hypothetical protein
MRGHGNNSFHRIEKNLSTIIITTISISLQTHVISVGKYCAADVSEKLGDKV